jgi:hypothetical protein
MLARCRSMVVLSALAAPACLHADEPPAHAAEMSEVGPPAPDENDPRWHAAVHQLAAQYEAWMPLDSPMRWSPELCFIPRQHARASAARDATPHGRKLYQLYVQDPEAYGARPTAKLWEPDPMDARAGARIEQGVVKRSYIPVRLEAPEIDPSPFDGLGPAEMDGELYAPGGDAGLFLMFRPMDAVAETDAGWVYATVTPEGEITGAGRMASCMSCHTRHEDRLFGLQPGDPAALTSR